MKQSRSRRPIAGIPLRMLIVSVNMLLVLLIIGLTMRRLGPPAGPAPAEVVSEVQDESAAPPAERADPSAPVAELDPEEKAALDKELGAAVDKSLAMQPVEMPAYWRLMRWAKEQSTAELAKRDPPMAVFQDLVQRPAAHRGELVKIELEVRRVLSYEVDPDNPAKAGRLYELWGWPATGRGWLYVVVTPELPPGFPVGEDVEATVVVYGYFYKLQGYQPSDAKPNARPLVAPLLIGRVASQQAPRPPAENSILSLVVLIAGGAILVGVIVGWFFAFRGKTRRRQQLQSSEDVVLPDDTAVDHESPGGPPRGDGFDWLREE